MIRIITDTSANLPIDVIRRYDLCVVPFSYTVDGKELSSPSGEFDGRAFYQAMREGAEVKTAMINIAAFTEVMQGFLEKGEDVLYIGMSGGISGTAHAASVAAEELREQYPQRRIAAIDTLAASLGEGLLVLEAARMREENVCFDDIVAYIDCVRHTMCQYFTVDDLEYLKRGGRLSRVATVIGTVLRIKPLLTGDAEGRIVLCGKVRGRAASLDALAERYEKLAADLASTVGIAHADDEEGAAALLERLRQRGLTGECLTVCYEPVTGAHVGPGTIALFFPGNRK